MGNVFYFEWEITLMEWLQSHVNGFGIAFFSAMTMLGEELLMILILGLLYWSIDKEKGKQIGLMVIFSNMLNSMVKNIFLRRRPYFDNPSIQVFRPVNPKADLYDAAAQEFSFPSGHAMNAVTSFGGVAYLYKKPWITVIAVILCFLVGLSRPIMGVHYPTDILVGWILGFIVVFLVHLLYTKVKRHWILYAAAALIGLLGYFYCKSEDYFTSMGMMLGYALAMPFEEKYVNFKNTKNWLRRILRVALGGGLYLVLNEAFKIPFNKEFLASASFLSHLVRTCRYTIVVFILLGVYPMLFNAVDRFLEKKHAKA